MLAFSSIWPSKGQVISPVSQVNSPYDEQHPVVDPSGNLFFTVAFHPQNKNGDSDPGDVWFSTRSSDNSFQPPVRIADLSTSGYDVVVGFPDEQTILLYHDGKEKVHGIHRYVGSGNSWKYESQLNLGNFRNRSNHFSGRLAPSGDVMVLSLESFGSYGNEDIYVSFLKDGGEWSSPQNLGPGINTFHQEMTPFLSSDKKSLFFSTNGHGSMQGIDIYYAERLDESWENWSKPRPLSSGNTIGAELAYFQLQDGSGEAVFTSTQNSEGYGDLRIVQVTENVQNQEGPITETTPSQEKPKILAMEEPAAMPDSIPVQAAEEPLPPVEEMPDPIVPAMPEEVIDPDAPAVKPATPAVKGEEVFDHVPDQPTENGGSQRVVLRVLDINTLEAIDYSVTILDAGGAKSPRMSSTDYDHSFPIGPNPVKELVVTAAGYLPMTLKPNVLANLHEPILMSPASKGVSIVLEDVLFKRGTAELLDENSAAPITGLAEFLQENPVIKILLEGHTDNLGNVRLNKELSLERASAVRALLLDQGIAFERIRIAGWGGAKPIDSNQTEEGRAKNRRVELVIVEN